jgi:glycosyltransferase involved in cell wall biosynthesis
MTDFISNKPLVSIGMPVYNDKKFLIKSLDSILSQSYNNIELIISDDNSIDGSEKICIEYSRKDDRIIYFRQEKNIGISKNMKFLLDKARGEYIMWAGDDDLWDKDFIDTLLSSLRDTNSISAFCPMVFIDEEDEVLINPKDRSTDYSGSNSFIRLKKLIKISDDSFGYGLFKKNEIKDVEFPIWWWINKNCSYNNIYPTLCFYLTKGGYAFHDGNVLWYNRLKQQQNVNHKFPFSGSFVLSYLAFILRKFNLVYFSLKSIIRAEESLRTAIKIFPAMLYYWFLVPIMSSPIRRYKQFSSGLSPFF